MNDSVTCYTVVFISSCFAPVEGCAEYHRLIDNFSGCSLLSGKPRALPPVAVKIPDGLERLHKVCHERRVEV